MESMRESWSDKRLDDLNAKVDRGFERVDAEVRALRVETRTEFVALRGEMKAGFERVDERFERIDERFDALHRLMIQLGGTVVVALIGLIATKL
jgi:tetrahydromethanopterin S-methyltransferase subunit G